MTRNGPGRSLVRRAREGDRPAFEGLVKSVEDRIKAFIRSRLRSSEGSRLDPDELYQETLVRAFGSLGSFRGEDPEDFRRWLAGVANKVVLRAREEGRRHRMLEIPEDARAKVVSPSKALRREERCDRLEAALGALRGEHRQVIRLTRIEGLSLREAAEKMGRSPEAVRKLFWRALGQRCGALSNTASLHLSERELDWEKRDGPEG